MNIELDLVEIGVGIDRRPRGNFPYPAALSLSLRVERIKKDEKQAASPFENLYLFVFDMTNEMI